MYYKQLFPINLKYIVLNFVFILLIQSNLFGQVHNNKFIFSYSLNIYDFKLNNTIVSGKRNLNYMLHVGPSPSIGYLIKDKIQFGINLSTSNSISPSRDTINRYYKNIGMPSPIMRYYFQTDRRFYIYLQDSFDLHIFKTNINKENQVFKKLNIGNTVSFGFIYYFQKKLIGDISFNKPLLIGRFEEFSLYKKEYIKLGVAFTL